MHDSKGYNNNSPDVIGRLKLLVQIAQANVESHRNSNYEDISHIHFSIQSANKTSNYKKKSKKGKKSRKTFKDQGPIDTPDFVMFQPQFSPRNDSIKAKRFNTRIDPLVKIEANTPYSSKKPKTYRSSTQLSTLSHYPRKFNSPSHSSFSRQHRLNQDSYIQSLSSLSYSRPQQNSKKSKSSLGRSNIVSITYKNQNPNLPYSRYSQLSLSQLS